MANRDARLIKRTIQDFSLNAGSGEGGTIRVKELPETGEEHTIYELEPQKVYNWITSPIAFKKYGYILGYGMSYIVLEEDIEDLTTFVGDGIYIRSLDKYYLWMGDEGYIEIPHYENKKGRFVEEEHWEEETYYYYYNIISKCELDDINSTLTVTYLDGTTEVFDEEHQPNDSEWNLLFQATEPTIMPMGEDVIKCDTLPTASEVIEQENVYMDGTIWPYFMDNKIWWFQPYVENVFYFDEENYCFRDFNDEVYEGELVWESEDVPTYSEIQPWSYEGGYIFSPREETTYWIYTDGNWVNMDDIPEPVEPPVLEPLNVTLTTSNQTIYPSEGIDGFNQVNVPAIEADTIPNYALRGFTNSGCLVLPSNVKHIGEEAFNSCYPLTQIVGLDVKTIGKSAFLGCTNLISATFTSPSLAEIGERAFNGCSNLTTIEAPYVKTIGKSAFLGCTNLSSAVLYSCQTLNDNFMGCSNLKNLTLPYVENVTSTFSGFLLSSLENIMMGSVLSVPTMFNTKNLIQATFPLAESMSNMGFMDCSKLTTINLPKIKEIVEQGFDRCYALQSVSFSQCEIINQMAFRDCYVLSKVSLPNCTAVGPYAFNYCSSLTELSLPKLVGYVSKGKGYKGQAIAWNSNLTTVNFPMLSYLETFTLAGCHNLSDVNIPMCTEIKSHAFEACYALSSIDLPNCITLTEYAFQSCSALTSLSLPVCTTMDTHTFVRCVNLTEVYLGASSVVTVINEHMSSYKPFYDTPISPSSGTATGHVYVPSSMYDAYMADPTWNTLPILSY